MAVSPGVFDDLALDLFRFQATYNPIYASYLQLLNTSPTTIDQISDIPFLPISLFKTQDVQTGSFSPERVFTSSGTTGTEVSRHYIRDSSWYLEHTKRGFESFYGSPTQYCWLCLLPSYLERQGSSLIEMARHFIDLSVYTESGFFLNDFDRLYQTILKLEAKQTPTVVLGVSFALLDFSEKYGIQSSDHLIWMETGGMKGRREEITRSELHRKLSQAFGAKTIHSEYGMTELNSQAYSKGNGIFSCSPSMKVFTRDLTDPTYKNPLQKRGQLLVLDLANIDSCAFIETEDIGILHQENHFEVLGRVDNSQLRGCSLMVSDL